MAIKVELGVESYRLVDPGSGEEGPLVSYGEIASLKCGGETYICEVEDPDIDHGDIVVEAVKDCISVDDREVEDVLFEGEEEETTEEVEELPN